MDIYTVDEAYKVLEEYGSPPNVIGHGEAVARVAKSVAEKLNENGFTLNEQLCEVAGLLHDMARVHDDHQNVAADWLRERGHDKEADIIAVHMTYPEFSPVEKTNETDLVCLGDRVCIEDKYVGIDERFDYIFNKTLKMAPDRFPIVEWKKKQMQGFINGIENIIGITLDELMREKF